MKTDLLHIASFAAVCALLREPSAPTLLTIAGAPVAEELAKAAAALMVLEKKPWFFPGAATLVALCAFSGFVFAGIENALYLFVYIDDPSPGIVLWRLVVCTSLHVVCAAVSGFGLARVWRCAARERAMPRLSLATPFLVAAILIHALYNLAATFLSIR